MMIHCIHKYRMIERSSSPSTRCSGIRRELPRSNIGHWSRHMEQQQQQDRWKLVQLQGSGQQRLVVGVVERYQQCRIGPL
jgi:hypothetical protein